MKAMLCEIGVLDKNNKLHQIFLKEGLNIITGKSSTGKSSLIEIVDYCFASSEYTVPEGIITNNAEIYYLVLQALDSYFILARHSERQNECYLKQETTYQNQFINPEYLRSISIINLTLYKKRLNSFFIGIDDVDDSKIAKEYRGRKSATPSIRSFTSFMFQHQNLIANKHALFYRFDEEEKREQVIEHTKIFLGFVDQEYFINAQNLEEEKLNLKALERERKYYEKMYEENKDEIQPKLSLLSALTGINSNEFPEFNLSKKSVNEFKEDINKVIQSNNLNKTLDNLVEFYFKLNEDLENHENQHKELLIERQKILRSLELERSLSSQLLNSSNQNQVIIDDYCICPFCKEQNSNLPEQARLLQEAINKVNKSIINNKSIQSELTVALNLINKDINNINKKIKKIKEDMLKISNRNQNIQQQRSLYEQSIAVKLELFSILDKVDLKNNPEIESQIDNIKRKINIFQEKNKKYDINKNINKANRRVNQIMNQIGHYFDFEQSYKPINLQFSFENFELYHQNNNEKKVYLRSMGSGANWLYSHLTLFLALHQYFIELDNELDDLNNDLFSSRQQCLIPSILIIDQPTQVYFPNFNLDNMDEFSKEELKKLGNNPKNFDENIKSVENIFNQIALYCTNLKKKFGYSPQIIITDHADNLNLEEGFDFEEFVVARWRNRGFIDI